MLITFQIPESLTQNQLFSHRTESYNLYVIEDTRHWVGNNMLEILNLAGTKFLEYREILYPQNNTDFLVYERRYPTIFALSTDITF